jgi:hypothetical protein
MPFSFYGVASENEKLMWGEKHLARGQLEGQTKGKVKEKRRLVISGIDDGSGGEEEAVRKWCETFGEVRAFKKKGKGCLVVDFRKASVADTVGDLSVLGLLVGEY